MKSLLALFLCLVASGAVAHKPSDSYLTLERSGATLQGRWDIALRDLDSAITLDADGDGEITWGEVRAKREAIVAYALSRLDVASGGAPCTLEASELLIDQHSDGAYAVLPLAELARNQVRRSRSNIGSCSTSIRPIADFCSMANRVERRVRYSAAKREC